MYEFFKKLLFNKENFEGAIFPVVVALAVIGIVCAIISHYALMSFQPFWFIFFELPLYIFLGWACYATWKIWKRFKNLEKK